MNYNGTRTIRITEENYQAMLEHKKKTRIPIAAFADKAISEKIKRIKSKKKL